MAGSPEEERTAPEASRRSNAGSSSCSSSSSSSSSDDDVPVEHIAVTVGGPDGRDPTEEPAAVDGATGGVVNARGQQCDQKVAAGRLKLNVRRSDLVLTLMVAGGVAVAVAAAFLASKKR
ncbi:uncharacterized protein [Triticum aestivum]|uniref:uncharacterized protein n=1 Tax=Triticum aestivum TaxID=4565 RepID=UPI001ABC624E|nr:uncharacterized protein LOC123170336 [Triticum aestivum]